MATTSRVVVVKTQLVTVLKARAGLTGIQVEFAWPGEKTERETIYCGRTRGSHDWAALRAGRKPRDEKFTFDLFIYALKLGGTMQEAETRAFALLAEVESAIADDPLIGLTPQDISSIKVGDFESDPGITTDGSACMLRVEIECTARLT